MVQENNTEIYTEISDTAMMSVWGRRPRLYQRDVIPHILKMMTNESVSQAVLMVQSTGSGKSSVPQTLAVVDGGVTIVIENTLALGADQMSKITNAMKNPGMQSPVTVQSFQLDAIKDAEEQKSVSKCLIDHYSNNPSSTLAVIIFSSPEALILENWTKMFYELFRRKVIKLFVIDEVHQFIDYGISFRAAFQQLKSVIINKIRLERYSEAETHNNKDLQIPLLLMTATFDLHLLNIIQTMLGVCIQPHNIFWGDFDSFSKQHIKIAMRYTNQTLRFLKSTSLSKLKTDQNTKMIVYSNTASRIRELDEKFKDFLDEEDEIEGDTVLIVGDQEPELKFAYSSSFTNSSFSIDKSKEDRQSIFYPRFLFGTSGCVGAGIDSADVHVVFRDGPPTSLINFSQEMGRCGRDEGSEVKNDFIICFHIDHFTYLFERIYEDNDENNIDSRTAEDTNQSNNDTANKAAEESKWRYQSLMQVLKMSVLDYGCWHCYLQTNSASPFLLRYSMEKEYSCVDKCPNCDGTQFENIKRISRQGICKFLAETLINTTVPKPYSPSELAKLLIEYPNVGRVVYRRRNSIRIESSSVAALTILQLIASNILALNVSKEDGSRPHAFVSIGIDAVTSAPNYMNDMYWAYIPHF